MEAQRRRPLTPDRIVAAAVTVADRGGLAGVSMRTVAAELGVQAMSLYHHIGGKDALLDLLADWVFAGIERPAPQGDWRAAMRTRAVSARTQLAAHPWSLSLVESRRNPGPQLLAHHEAVLAALRAAGFSVPMATHAFSAIDAYVYGFVLNELNVPIATGSEAEAFADELAIDAEAYPHLARMLAEQVAGGGYVFGDEFGYGLDILLDGLDERLRGEQPASGAPDARRARRPEVDGP